MRAGYLILGIILLMVGCKPTTNNSPNKQSSKTISHITPYLYTDSLESGAVIGVKEIGRVTSGEQIEVAVAIKNTTDKPLVILSVTPSCGCTSIEASLEPLAKDEERLFRIVYDTKGKVGVQLDQILFKGSKKSFMIMLKSYVNN